jgi:hypothetical protein
VGAIILLDMPLKSAMQSRALACGGSCARDWGRDGEGISAIVIKSMRESDYDAKGVERRRRGPIPAGWVKLVTCGTANEAELIAAVLAGEGIGAQVFGANINAVDWFWQVFNDVDLLVQESDVERAREVLSRTSNDDVEPAEEAVGSAPPCDEEGRLLVPVGAFENIRNLRDAQTVLASARIDAYAPRLVLRGDRAAGVGKRFILRVAEGDLEKAKVLLAEEAEENRDEPRCPRCGSWRVTRRTSLPMHLADLVGLAGPGEIQCNSCDYRADAAEFLKRAVE